MGTPEQHNRPSRFIPPRAKSLLGTGRPAPPEDGHESTQFLVTAMDMTGRIGHVLGDI